MREKFIEGKLVREVKKRGGLCLKWVCPSFDGMPDRVVLLPGKDGGSGLIGFVEVKAQGKKPRPLQLSRHKMLRDLGFKVYILDDIGQIGGIIDGIIQAT